MPDHGVQQDGVWCNHWLGWHCCPVDVDSFDKRAPCYPLALGGRGILFIILLTHFFYFFLHAHAQVFT